MKTVDVYGIIQIVIGVATAGSVLFAAVQIRISQENETTRFEDAMAREYRDITQRIPTRAMLGEPLSDTEFQDAFDEFYRYFSLSNEQVFFAHALLQPYAESLAKSTSASNSTNQIPLCPFCGSRPQVAAMRPEGDGAKRSLICSVCATEWNFKRVACPNCGEENKDRLPVYIADAIDYVRVDACDTCHTYMKSIDLTKNGHAVPVVDEIATISLNLWAEENNYQKFGQNLFGM